MEILQWLSVLMRGLVVTLELTVVTTILTTMVAAALAIAQISPITSLRLVARWDVDLFRSIPLLALFFFFFFGIGPVVGRFGVDTFWIAVLALTLSESAYLAEVFRGALQAVPATQWDASVSLGLGWASIVRLVVLPQALPPSIPAIVNVVIGIIKDSSLASLIAVSDVTLSATVLVANTFRPLEVYLVLALVYLAVILPLSYLARYSEVVVGRRLGVRPRLAPAGVETSALAPSAIIVDPHVGEQ
jgi:His/Glu/Gln/Arg/opine family amino acid ABC transporter permease subunit